MIRTVIALFFLGFMLTACSDAEGPTPAPQNNDQNQTNNNNPPNNDNGDNVGIEYAETYQTRFTSLRFRNTSPGASLNNILAQNFDQERDFPIVVLVETTDHDLENGTMTLRGASGTKTDTQGVYNWETAREVPDTQASLDPETGRFEGQLDRFYFVASVQFANSVETIELPITELSIAGRLNLSEDGSEAGISGGTLEGFITKEEADEISVVLFDGGEPVILTNLLTEDALNYDVASGERVEEGGDAWWLEATYEAVPTTIQ